MKCNVGKKEIKMHSFKNWLKEAKLDLSLGKDKATHWNTSKGESKLWSSKTKQLHETDTHTIHKIDKGGGSVVYYAKKKKSGDAPHVTINGTQDGNAVHIDSMAKHPSSTIKMHEFIKHLVAKGDGEHDNLMFGSNHFSFGGAKVFESIENEPNSEVDVSHFKQHKMIPKGEPFSDDSVYLVAHKKQIYPTKTSEFHKELNESQEWMADDRNPEYDGFHAKKFHNPVHAATVARHTKGSRSLNNYLHGRFDGYMMGGFSPQNLKADPYMDRRVRAMDSVFDDKSNHVGHDIHVMTGLPDSPASVVSKETKRLGGKPRHVNLHMVGYTSTTDRPSVATDFAEQDENLNKHILHIHVPKDFPAISAEQSSDYTKRSEDGEILSSEREFILHRGAILKMDSEPEVDEDGHHHWFAKVVGRHQE